MSRLWIVRHGNTFEPQEAPRRIGARTDLFLVSTGRAQAQALAARFAADGIAFDRVLSSPLRRTWETAEVIAGSEAGIEACDWLAEIDHGPDEGCPESEVIARIGADAIAAWDRKAVPPPGWITDADRRACAWREMFGMIAPGENILAVASSGAARFAFQAGITITGLPSSLKLRTGAWGLIASDSAGWRVVEWDCRP